MSTYARLSQSVRARILDAFTRDKGAGWREGDERALHLDHFLMLRVCVESDVQALGEVLDLGLDPDLVPSCDAASSTGPLGSIVRGPNPLPLAKLLLARGANPNFLTGNGTGSANVSPMHDAVIRPELLGLLLDHGGDVHLRTPEGAGLLDAWVWSLSYVNQAGEVGDRRALQSMDLLLSAGVNPRETLVHDSHLLVECWFRERRNLILPLIERGFDPRQKGAGPGWMGKSLVARLQRSPRNALAQGLLADIQARELHASTLPAGGKASLPRL